MNFKEIQIKTSLKTEMYAITDQVCKFVSENMNDGLVHIFSTHTTAGITINENADPSVKSDMMKSINKLIPFEDSYTHLEGNSAAHIKTTLTGLSESVPVVNGKILLGTWQGIYFCEYDGPRNRKILISAING